MKITKPLYIITILAFLSTGCSTEEVMTEPESVIKSSINPKKQNIFSQNNDQINYPIRSRRELIISFKVTATPDVRAFLRNKYAVVGYEICDCTNQRIEKWEFKPDINIEERLGDITDETDVEGVDYQYLYPYENQVPGLDNTNDHTGLIASMVTSGNRRVNIAVLDTGINLNNLPYSAPFLYNSSLDSRTCIEDGYPEISGWDFVNHDNDPFDDKGHGTVVVQRIIKRLQRHEISNYSILPVKVFNQDGKGTTFDILCGYLYTVSKPNIHIMNMSFGWYGAPSSLLDLYINENNHILHITSAGNSNENNDGTPHYPSNIPEDHLLAIGSYQYNKFISKTGPEPIIELSSFSNYGSNTVDFLSRGEHIFFEDTDGDFHPIKGTSYAAPIVVAEAAKYYTMGYTTPPAMILQLRLNATLITSISLPVFYSDRIIE